MLARAPGPGSPALVPRPPPTVPPSAPAALVPVDLPSGRCVGHVGDGGGGQGLARNRWCGQRATWVARAGCVVRTSARKVSGGRTAGSSEPTQSRAASSVAGWLISLVAIG